MPTLRSPTEYRWADLWAASESEVRRRADEKRNLIVMLVVAGIWAVVALTMIATLAGI